MLKTHIRQLVFFFLMSEENNVLGSLLNIIKCIHTKYFLNNVCVKAEAVSAQKIKTMVSSDGKKAQFKTHVILLQMKFRIKHFKSFPQCVDVDMKMNSGVWMICFLMWKGKKKHLRLTCSLIVKKELKD